VAIISGGAGGAGGTVEYDYVERNTALTVTATTEGTAQAFIDGNAVTYDGTTKVKIEFWCGFTANINDTGVITLLDGATAIGWLSQIGNNSATIQDNLAFYGCRFLTPTAASHTYHIAAWKTSGTFIVTGGAGGAGTQVPAWYRITKA